MSSLHGVEPYKSYDEVKQLALGIEHSKAMFALKGFEETEKAGNWKIRSSTYKQMGAKLRFSDRWKVICMAKAGRALQCTDRQLQCH